MVQRICNYCGREFTARTTVTQYCNDVCSKRAYKAKLKASKIEVSNAETKRTKGRSNEELKNKEFLTVTQVSKLIGCSRQNIYKLISTGKLKATNILQKKTIILRADLDHLFTDPTNLDYNDDIPLTQKQEINDWLQAGAFDIAQCYTLAEVQAKYQISEKALYDLIKKNNVPKVKRGWFAYVPKILIDRLLN